MPIDTPNILIFNLVIMAIEWIRLWDAANELNSKYAVEWDSQYSIPVLNRVNHSRTLVENTIAPESKKNNNIDKENAVRANVLWLFFNRNELSIISYLQGLDNDEDLYLAVNEIFSRAFDETDYIVTLRYIKNYLWKYLVGKNLEDAKLMPISYVYDWYESARKPN